MVIDDQFLQILSIFLKIFDNYFASPYLRAFYYILWPSLFIDTLFMPEEHLSDPNNQFLFIPGVVILILLIDGILHNINHTNNGNILFLASHTILMPSLELILDLGDHKPILTIDI